MNQSDRILDILDPVIKRPGMFIQEDTLKLLFQLIFHYDYALIMAERCNDADKGIKPIFENSSKHISKLLECVDEELSLNESQIYQYPISILEKFDGNETKAFKWFQSFYTNYRGEKFGQYMEKFNNLNKNA